LTNSITPNDGWNLKGSPYLYNEYFYAIKEITQNEAVVVGGNGTILKINSDDHIITKQESGTNSTLKALSFIDDKTGWVVGENSTILKTTDAGLTWLNQSISGNYDLTAVCFVDYNKGWIIDHNGALLKTSNGGMNWENLKNPPSALLFSMQFIDSLMGWISTSFGIWKTTDGGITWTEHKTGVTCWGIFFIDSLTGWAVGTFNSIYQTTDGGNNWTSKPNQIAGTRLLSVYFINEMVGYATGESNVSLKTTDGGETWEKLSIIGGYSVFASSLKSIWIAGYGMILRSTDGYNWNTLINIFDRASSSTFYNSDIGWIYGNAGIIYKTTDGGNLWNMNRIILDKYEVIFSICFVDSLYGFASSTKGIYKTTDGGYSWLKTSQSSYPYKLIKMKTLNEGFGTDEQGNVYLTSDSGINWNIVFSATIELNSIFNFSPGISWAAGGNSNVLSGIILKTSDKGLTWSVQNNNLYPQLNSVFFYDNYVGCAVGNSGTILYTSNGGINWEKQTSGTTENLQSVYFINPNAGWIVGDNSTILYTTDSGSSWQKYLHPFISNFKNVQFVNSKTGWITGDNRTVLRTDNNGGLSTIYKEDNIPDNHYLKQNYPNPFNPTTTIEYSIPEQTNVTLRIFDILGREVITLVNAEKPAGNYKVEFNGSSLPSGIYFYRMGAGSYFETKKFILLR